MFDPTTINAAILQKLRDYYPSFNSVSDADLWVAFVNTWNRLMARLCWNDKTCVSMLTNPRVLFVRVNPEGCRVVEIEMQHSEITSVESAEITTYSKTGKTKIMLENLADYWVEGTKMLRIYLSREDQKCLCRCDESYIKINYTAGYKEIPDCFYTAIGLILGNAMCKLNNCADQDCQNTDQVAMNAVLTQRDIDGERWVFEVPNNFIQDALDQGEVNGILNLLDNYSNCINKLTFSAGAYPSR